MDYTQYPTVPGVPPPARSRNTIDPSNFAGSGTFSGGNVFNWGGPSGITVNGNQGLWAGASQIANAPFSIDLKGNLIANQATIQTSNTGNRIVIDSANDRIIFYDNSNTIVGVISATLGSVYFAPNSSEAAAGLAINSQSHVVSLTTQLNTLSQLVLQAADNAFHSTGISLTPTNVSIQGNTAITGTFSATGTKSFDIPHPTKEGMRLNYVALECPEVLVMCRGIADTEEEIEYPDHFMDVTEVDSIQCQIGKLKGSEKISWLATGVRRGYANHPVEYRQEDQNVTN